MNCQTRQDTMLFGRKQARKRDTALGLDLGNCQWKAVVLRRTEQGLHLDQYALTPCPAPPGKAESQAPCAEALQTMLAKLKTGDGGAYVTISSPSGLVTEMEVPRLSAEELGSVLRLNSTRYLRRDLSGYYLDAVELGDTTTDGKARRAPTMQALIVAAPKEEVLWCRGALSAAKIKAETIELSAVAVINAIQRSQAELCEQNVVLLLDIGHQLTSLNLLLRGQPVLTRLMPFGGAQITDQIARELGVPPAAAEEQKRAMNGQTTAVVHGALQSLAREVRSSIDFVERQHDCDVRHAFAGGGTACNPAIVAALSEEVGLAIQCWNPLEGYDLAGTNATELAAIGPVLGAAVGVAASKL
jgi:type IV pilus assembly protein PilM